MNDKKNIQDYYPLSFPIKKDLIPLNVYDNEITEFLYNIYIINLYHFKNQIYPFYVKTHNIVKCTESELPTFKKLGYTYYQDGSISGDSDDSNDISLYRVGYYIDTIPDYYGVTKRWMPILDNKIRMVRIELNWEFKYKYKEIINRIKNNNRWGFLLDIMSKKINTEILLTFIC